MENRPRGRAALKEALLRTLRKTGETEACAALPAPGPAVSEPPPEVPKPRGRAELFKKLKSQLTTPGTTTVSAPAAVATPTSPTSLSTLTEKVQKLEVQPADAPPFKKSEKGSSGTQIGIVANYIRMNRDEGKGFHRYEVKFEPSVDSKSARNKLIYSVVPQLGGVHIFNGVNDLYLPVELPEATKVFEVPHPFNSDEQIEITIIYKRLEPFGSRDGLHFLNVLFKRIMNNLKLMQINRSYFDFTQKVFIPQYALEIIPGYSVAVDEMEGGLMICLDTCHKLLRKKSVFELLVEIRHMYREGFKQKVADQLLGQVVLTIYNNLTYAIEDILWDMKPTDTFESRSGSISYIEYYKKQYGIQIQNETQPLLLNLKKTKTAEAGKEEERRICLIPELCNLTGISQDMMTHKFRRDMAAHTQLPPAKRFDTLRSYIDNVRNSPTASKILKDWGLSIVDGAIDLNARVLTDNKITFRNKKIDLARTTDWAKDIGRDNLINPIDMTNWIVLCPQSCIDPTEKFVKRFRDLARGFGCRIDQPMVVPVGKGTDIDYRKALEANANDHVQILLVVVPAQRESLYGVIKNTTLARKGIVGQVVLLRTLQNEKILGSVTLKIGLQMQAKLGGSLWAIVFPSICADFMFGGIDTFHHVRHKKSVGALVCSIDALHTRYHTGVAFQAHEITDALKLSFVEALEARKRMTGRFPNVVFMVRDGVGDGQLPHVQAYELKQYLDVRDEIGAPFKLCFLVIQKRINTKLMAPGGVNPPAGTVLDHTITRRNYDDFYLVPQSSRVGTVCPSRFVVLHNDAPELNLDRIQKLTFKLCHMYYNWTGAVSVPAPCQYAHKAAYLIGEHMERKPLDSLSEKLYYL